MSGGDGGGVIPAVPPLLSSLFLFACSARLWLALNNDGGDDGGGGRRRRRRRAVFSSAVATTTESATKASTPQSLSASSSSLIRKNDSWASFLLSKTSVVAFESDGGGDAGEQPAKRERRMSEDARSMLMERISMSDAVLTRDAVLSGENSLDFHPKNSNWCHFENYAPNVSPLRRGSVAEFIAEKGGGEKVKKLSIMEEEEDFLWSEPPNLNHVETPDDSTASDDDAASKPLDDSSNNRPRNRRRSTMARRMSTMSRRMSSDIDETLQINAEFLPSKLTLIRHGQSEGNLDEELYAVKPDNAMGLTKLGWEMAKMAGVALRDQLPAGETVHFIVSPYARTVETFHGIASAWCDPEEFKSVPDRSKRMKMWYTRLMEMGLTWHEDPRIREQDFGNYQDPHLMKKAKAERHKFGSFYYRFPHGESASDVFDRVSTFLDSLWRSFESGRAQNYVLVAHGISIRVFLARYFRYSIDQFHLLANPLNCEMITLAHDNLGRMRLDGRCELELSEVETGGDETSESDGDNKYVNGEGKGSAKFNGKAGTQKKKARSKTTTTVVTGYKRHSRLRTLPPQYVRPRSVRMYYNDT